MKDYSMNEEERKYFIRYFKSDKKGNIITYFANRVKHVSSDNIQNEKTILSKMEEQVKNSDGCFKKYERKRFNSKGCALIFGFCFGLVLSLLKLVGTADAMTDILARIFIGFSGAITVISTIQYVSAKIMLDDLKKNRKFMEIKDELNSNVRSNENMLIKTSCKTRKMVEDTRDNEPVFNINSLNSVPFKDLEQIMVNIQREKRFNFVYNENTSYDEEEYVDKEEVAVVRKKTR